jgi:hypothetical protein
MQIDGAICTRDGAICTRDVVTFFQEQGNKDERVLGRPGTESNDPSLAKVKSKQL